MPLVLWFFEEKTASGRWRRLRWMMTNEDAERYAAKNNVELRKLDNTREERLNLWGDGGSIVPRARGK